MLELLKDLWGFMRARKKFWLAPLIVMLLLLGVLIVLSQGSAVAPFIYTLNVITPVNNRIILYKETTKNDSGIQDLPSINSFISNIHN